MSLDWEQSGGTVVVRANGELDLTTGPELESCVNRVLDDGPPERVVLDLSQVAFLDSSGVSALIGAWRLCRKYGSYFRVGNTSPFVARVLDVTGLADVLTLEPSPGT
jgi:anti-sigma B factor antagonist